MIDKKVNLLVIGGGGREHAIAWKLSKSQRAKNVYIAPGNAGTMLEKGVTNVDINHIDEFIKFAKEKNIDLTVVGPEAYLADGIVDEFKKNKLNIFGPSMKASALESSKIFAKSFMVKNGIPTAQAKSFTDPQQAFQYLKTRSFPIVIKADGLAAGKGVQIVNTIYEAERSIKNFLINKIMGDAGASILIEDFIVGEEISFISLMNNKNFIPFLPSQDHKRLLNDDQGPNTGGMGAYTPTPFMTNEIYSKVIRNIMEPIISGLNYESIDYCGFFYVGLIIDKENNPHVLEFNCRLGDPETQPLLFKLESDLFEIINDVMFQKNPKIELEWNPKVSLGVVVASEGYPEKVIANRKINNIPLDNENQKIFHASTVLDGNTIKTTGGRNLCITVLDDSISKAQIKAKKIIKKIELEGMQFRTDIGSKVIKNLKS